MQKGKARVENKLCLFREKGEECCKLLVRVLREICLIQTTTSFPGIRRGRQVCKAICANEDRQDVWEMESPVLLWSLCLAWGCWWAISVVKKAMTLLTMLIIWLSRLSLCSPPCGQPAGHRLHWNPLLQTDTRTYGQKGKAMFCMLLYTANILSNIL